MLLMMMMVCDNDGYKYNWTWCGSCAIVIELNKDYLI